MMEDIGLFKQGRKWLQSKQNSYSVVRTIADNIALFIERHWPMVCCGCAKLGNSVLFSLIHWKDSVVRGFRSFGGRPAALLAFLVITWGCCISLTSMSCLVYVLLSMGAVGVAGRFTPGVFIFGLVATLILWMFANFWITGTLFIVGGYLFCLNHARLVVLMVTVYALVGWPGVFLSINLAFLSSDILSYFVQWCDNLSESIHVEEQTETESFTEEDFSTQCEYSAPSDEPETVQASTSSDKPATPATLVSKQRESSAKQVAKEDASSIIEIKRILSSRTHYEALGFVRYERIDGILLKKEYRKKARLVHPDKNMGSPLASESFKKLLCAYGVLSDAVKKRDYDEQLQKEESKSIIQRSPSSSHQV